MWEKFGARGAGVEVDGNSSVGETVEVGNTGGMDGSGASVGKAVGAGWQAGARKETSRVNTKRREIVFMVVHPIGRIILL
jgi:hypothetical protein